MKKQTERKERESNKVLGQLGEQATARALEILGLFFNQNRVQGKGTDFRGYDFLIEVKNLSGSYDVTPDMANEGIKSRFIHDLRTFSKSGRFARVLVISMLTASEQVRSNLKSMGIAVVQWGRQIRDSAEVERFARVIAQYLKPILFRKRKKGRDTLSSKFVYLPLVSLDLSLVSSCVTKGLIERIRSIPYSIYIKLTKIKPFTALLRALTQSSPSLNQIKLSSYINSGIFNQNLSKRSLDRIILYFYSQFLNSPISTLTFMVPCQVDYRISQTKKKFIL